MVEANDSGEPNVWIVLAVNILRSIDVLALYFDYHDGLGWWRYFKNQ